MKKIISLLLSVIIIFNTVNICFADSNQSVNDLFNYLGHYNKDVFSMFNRTMDGYIWTDYFDSDEAFAFVQFKNQMDNNKYPLFQNALTIATNVLGGKSIVDVAWGDFDINDAKVEYYETALASLLLTMEDNLSADIEQQSKADSTKSEVTDYIKEGVKTIADFSSTWIGLNSKGFDQKRLFSQAFDICSVSIDYSDIGIDTIEEYEFLQLNSSTFMMYHDLLEVVTEWTDDDLLKRAAENLLQAIDICFKYRIENLKDLTKEGSYAAGHTFFNVLDDILEKDKQNVSTIFSSDELSALAILNKVSGLYGSFQVGKEAGVFISDVIVGGSNTIIRYYELVTMALVRESLIAEISKVRGTIHSDKDIDKVLKVQSLLYNLLYVNARGEYCIYSLLSKDSNLLSLFFNDKEYTDNWYSSVVSCIYSIKRCVDNIFPDMNYYIETFESCIDGYAAVLQDIHQNPSDYVDTQDIEKAEFSIFDINQDGINELIVRYTGTHLSAAHTSIWTYDTEMQMPLLCNNLGLSCEYYSNGIIKNNAAHSSPYGKLWPYDLCLYNNSKKKFESIYNGYSIEKGVAGELYNPKLDVDSDGIIYYFNKNYDEVTPLTKEEYGSMIQKYIPEEKKIDLVWHKITNSEIGLLNKKEQ